MSEDLYLCQKEIRRLRWVVRCYEAQMRKMEDYLEQLEERKTLGDEAMQTVHEISDFWRQLQED
ncbi:hypothetical protein D3Z53_06985 [Lachnospiraceae bacterium]|nr:hypothetical protein [uncultured Schaedlerella sp.]EOS40020.1 hypothetical protein C808_00991 [Lachnospiraceae bacterium M18-1]MDE7067063.1 hypothetical protein [Schaedlerella arabinosiphila]NBI57821.1 hypothetical protein [Lachnospiraceae bacterium]